MLPPDWAGVSRWGPCIKLAVRYQAVLEITAINE